MRTSRQCFFDAVRDAKDILCEHYPFLDWMSQYGEGMLYDIGSYDVADDLLDDATFNIEHALNDFSIVEDIDYLYDVFTYTVETLALKLDN